MILCSSSKVNPNHKGDHVRLADREYVLKLMDRVQTVNLDINSIHPNLKNDKEIWIKMMDKDAGFDPRYYPPLPEGGDDDLDVILSLIKRSHFFAMASDRLKDDLNMAIQAIRLGVSVSHFSERIKNHPLVIDEVLKSNNCWQYYALPETVMNLKDLTLNFIEKGLILSEVLKACPHWKDDDDILLAGIQQNGTDLAELPDRLKDDLVFVKIAVEQDPDAFQYASDRLKDDLELVKMAVEKSYQNVVHASLRCQTDPSIIAIIKNILETSDEIDFRELPVALQYEPTIYQLAKDRIIANLLSDNDAFFFIRDTSLTKDLDIIDISMQVNWSTYLYLPKNLQKIKHLFETFKKHVIAYINADYTDRKNKIDVLNLDDKISEIPQCTDDEELMLTLIQKNSNHVNMISPRLKKDKAFALSCVKIDWRCLKVFSAKIQADQDVYQIAKTQVLSFINDQSSKPFCAGDFGHHACKAFLKDREIILLAVQKSWTIICDAKHFVKDKEIYQLAKTQLVNRETKSANNQFYFNLRGAPLRLVNEAEVIEMVLNPDDIENMEFLSKETRSDRDFVLRAVSVSWRAFRFINPIFYRDLEIVLKANEQNAEILPYVQNVLKINPV